MKAVKKNKSAEQYYIDMSDGLAALRSAKGFVYTLIAAAVLFTVIFNAFFGVFRINDAVTGSGDDIAVLVKLSPDDLKKGDIVVLSDGDGYYCAELTETAGGLFTGSDENKRELSYGDIRGKAFFIVFPVSELGNDARKLCIK